MGLPNDQTVYKFIKNNCGDYFCKHTGLDENGLKVSTKKQLSSNEVAHIFDSLAKITIKAFPEHNKIFMDGDYIKLEVGSDHKKVSFEWHCEPPTGWEHLSDMTKQLQQLFYDP